MTTIKIFCEVIYMETRKYAELVAGSPRGEVIKALIDSGMPHLVEEFKKLGMCRQIKNPEVTIRKMVVDLVWALEVDCILEKDLSKRWQQKFFLAPVVSKNAIYLIDHWIESQILAARKIVAQGAEQGVEGVGDPSEDL